MRTRRKAIPLALSVAALIALPAAAAWAQWVENGAPLCTAAQNQDLPAIASDGDGGAIVAWRDYRGGTYSDIYAQRVDGLGAAQWTADGVAVCTATGNQAELASASDGEGGAIVTWRDYRGGGSGDIYAQRVDASGAAQWTANGVAVCTATGTQGFPRITSDGSGGAIVTWRDLRTDNGDVYAQRVDASGAPQWTTDGVALCTATGIQDELDIVSDGAGGAIVIWRDPRDGTWDVYAQRVSASGAIQWATNGVVLCAATGAQWDSAIASDGAGGAIVTWRDYRGGGSADIYAQNVDASGAVQWTADGVALCTAAGDQFFPEIVSDGAGGAIVTWDDGRSGITSDIYAQRLDASGAAQWTTNGVALCEATGSQSVPTIVSDGASGAIVTWSDYRNGNYDVYAQGVSASGAVQWSTNGVDLCSASQAQYSPRIVSDGAGGAIVTWYDYRNGNYDVYAQRVFGTGVRGHEVPHITSISDVPNDQGGRIKIQWDRCFILEDPDPTIIYYSIWRRLPLAISALATESSDITDVAMDFAGVAHRMFQGSDDYAWEWITNVQARRIDSYTYVVKSRYDSTGSDTGWQVFVVTGHTDDPFVYYDSPPDSGYSVDNLSPSPPAALAAEYIGDQKLCIHWQHNSEPDLYHYAVYRGTTPDFVSDETNRIGTPSDSSFVDDDLGYVEYCYKVSAIDIHENEGPRSLLTPDMITGSPRVGRDHSNVLFQNAPNPFVSSTRIVFSMKEEGHVRLIVFDAKGRLVRMLVDGVRAPSEYVEEWDGRDSSGRLLPSGTYFYSLEVPRWSASKKMTLAR